MHPGGHYPDPAGGTWEVTKEVHGKSVWANRTRESSSGHEWIQDITFEMLAPPMNKTEKRCSVQGFSMSKDIEHHPHGNVPINFCNIYNVFNYTRLDFGQPTLTDCDVEAVNRTDCNELFEEKSEANKDKYGHPILDFIQ